MPRQRKGGWQVDVQLNGTRFRKTYADEETAIKAENLARERLRQGLPPEPEQHQIKPVLFGELMKLALNRYWVGSKNEREQRRQVGELIEFFGPEADPRGVTSNRIDDLIAHLRAIGNSPGTINRKLSTLSKALKFAASRGMIDSLPLIERMKEAEGRMRCYAPEEIQRVLGYLESTGQGDFRDVVIFLVETGARAGEAARLLWDDVDLDTGVVKLYETKSGKARGIPLSTRVTEMLHQRRSMILTSARQGARVFPGWVDKRNRTTPMSSAWIAARTQLKMDGRLHDLRHTFASRLVQQGVGILTVQQLLGHGSVQMTMRYAHLAPENLRDAIATLDGVTHSGLNPRAQAHASG